MDSFLTKEYIFKRLNHSVPNISADTFMQTMHLLFKQLIIIIIAMLALNHEVVSLILHIYGGFFLPVLRVDGAHKS